MKFSRRKKVLASALAIALIAFLVVPFLIPIPPLAGTFPPDRLGKSDSRFALVNGIKVHYKMYGSGEPVIVLMHGFGAYSFSFDPVMQPLSEYGTVIAFDRPAFGFTERPILDGWEGPNPYTNEFAADLAVGLMDELGIGKAILVGHSAGGAVAILTYYRHPERVSALILEDAAVYGGGAPWYISPFLWLPQVQRLGPLLVRGIAGDSGISTIYLAWHDDSKITPDIIEGYRRPLMADGWDYALWQYTLASGRSDLKSNLSSISVPVLVMTGSDDKIVPPTNAFSLAEEIPWSSFVVIPDCGHIPHEETPQEFLGAVISFLRASSLASW
ncbi:MAG: alpha/beta fold hydrolase [Candidatus Methanosuratincola sp.]|nr:alpha/beta hydrolase [Candidatus Methanosuratincola sp.]